MKSKAPNFEFDPGIRIFGSGEHLLVVFDSQSPHDVLRAPRTVRIPKGFQQLSLLVAGFDTAEDDGHQRLLKGSVSLAIEDATGALSNHELAALQLVFHAEADRKGALTHIDPALVAYTVRQALAQCLNEALNDYFQRDEAQRVGGQLQPAAFNASLPVAAPQPSHKALREQAADDAARQARSRRRKTALAWVVPPLVVVAVMATMSHLASSPSPIENAVAQQMANDPESIKAQVELTKQTLQSMGLDPGQGGDLGCLAPQ
ncbi:hypothetical protein QEM42_003547 [Pseudomonas putida]|uniref:hypothetical protein n=1 Tax=Pseudomonas TaxID=286 RepID=UPI001198AC73|nr:hypothetical protein [Pseudomonas putida]EKT4562348.1 hypothetical protein [Pseudomonas putida]MDP9540525.1 hypothetical protein [Pseudomonas putida]QDY36778.1 hypothetical protein CHR26_11155 [Pseudomonas putida]